LTASDTLHKYNLTGAGFEGGLAGCADLGRKGLNIKKIFYWYSRTVQLDVDKQFPEADLVLGWLYLRGVGTSIDKQKALELFLKIAPPVGSNGCYSSEGIGLAEIYATGASGIPADPKLAAYYKDSTLRFNPSCNNSVVPTR
jgi:hypothetical protein